MIQINRVGLSFLNNELNPYKDIKNLEYHINNALLSGGLGKKNKNNPIQDIIDPGESVMIKPNWVNHYNQSGKGMDSLVTHPNFIEAVINLLVKCKPSKIIIGDAPIQGCNFDLLVPLAWREKIKSKSNIDIEIIDMRRTILKNENSIQRSKTDLRDLDKYILFDIKEDSYLEPITNPDTRFRVTSYNPKLLGERHKQGKHQYLIAKEPLMVDKLFNLPKLKTHKKSGITGALKNLVGINGNKEFLPHHRVGGKDKDGDCYPGNSKYKTIIEFLLDKGNENFGSNLGDFYFLLSKILLKTYKAIGLDSEIEGGWYGNDTTWRMALDLNKIFIYGNLDGTLSPVPVRKIYTITDGIIAGQKDGPLNVDPIFLGAISFSVNSVFAELVHATLMGFNWKKIPLIRESLNTTKFPLTKSDINNLQLYVNSLVTDLSSLFESHGKKFIPAKGWIGHIEN